MGFLKTNVGHHWTWDPKYSVGVNIIDEQHKKLIDYINQLTIAHAYKKIYMLEEVLKELIDYTKSHFAFEEKLMEEAGYQNLENHKEVHKAFIERIEFFKERYESGEDVSKQLKMDLQLWMLEHIQHEDKGYSKIVQKVVYKHSSDPEAYTSESWIDNLLKKFF